MISRGCSTARLSTSRLSKAQCVRDASVQPASVKLSRCAKDASIQHASVKLSTPQRASSLQRGAQHSSAHARSSRGWDDAHGGTAARIAFTMRCSSNYRCYKRTSDVGACKETGVDDICIKKYYGKMHPEFVSRLKAHIMPRWSARSGRFGDRTMWSRIERNFDLLAAQVAERDVSLVALLVLPDSG